MEISNHLGEGITYGNNTVQLGELIRFSGSRISALSSTDAAQFSRFRWIGVKEAETAVGCRSFASPSGLCNRAAASCDSPLRFLNHVKTLPTHQLY